MVTGHRGNMPRRRLGRTDMDVSVIGFGAWAIGGGWGRVDDAASIKALHAAVDAGTNFIDTADVYGDGHSERLVARLRRERRGERLYVATKAGRRLMPQDPANYTRANLTGWVERSLRNLEMDAIDLLQLHCPPSVVLDRAEVFGALDDLVAAGKIRYYGVSIVTIDEARRAMCHPGVQSVQLIVNMLRQKPIETVLAEASRRQVGLLARVPLASGLLTGKLTAASAFAADDHRQFNRDGAAFDKGETFSGVPYDLGLLVVERLKAALPAGADLATVALRWILMHDAITTTIPGARTAAQARTNAAAGAHPPLDDALMARVREIYDEFVRPVVHAQW